jgi:Ca-activated chloride channel homolog
VNDSGRSEIFWGLVATAVPGFVIVRYFIIDADKPGGFGDEFLAWACIVFLIAGLGAVWEGMQSLRRRGASPPYRGTSRISEKAGEGARHRVMNAPISSTTHVPTRAGEIDARSAVRTASGPLAASGEPSTRETTPPGPPDERSPVRLSARFDRSDLSAGLEHDVYCLLEISFDPAPKSTDRAPFDLAIVIDRSGSMATWEIEIAKSCAAFLAGRMGPADRVAVIAFDAQPELLVPLSTPSDDLVEAIEAIGVAGGRTNLCAAWKMAVDIIAQAEDRGAVRRVLLLTDWRPNLGDADPETLTAFAHRAYEQRGVATCSLAFGHRSSMNSLLDALNEAGVPVDPVWDPDDPPVVLAHYFPALLTRVAEGASLEIRPAEGVSLQHLEAPCGGGRIVGLGHLVAEFPRRHLFRLRVPPIDVPGPLGLGEVVLRYSPIVGPPEPRELRTPLLANVVSTGATGLGPRDQVATRTVATQKFRAVKDMWDRGLMRGSRDALADAAAELEAMGAVGAPLAEELLRRVAELDAEKDQRRRVLEWCDRSPSGRLVVVAEAHGTVGWMPIEALPPSRAEERTEDARRLLMVGVARLASRIEAATSGAPAVVQREDLPEESLGAVEGEVFREWDWRIDPQADFAPRPVPEDIVRWWEANRGLVSVRCSLHGEIARFDVSRSIGMLGPGWDSAVVEYHNRWERAWDETYDTEEYDGCGVRIEPTWEPGGPNLLDVKEMWIVTEGSGRPWWPYRLLPDDGASGAPA